jgi:hypothetical protein
VASKATRDDDVPTLQETLDSPIPTPLVREWAKASLASGLWKDAMVAAVSVSIHAPYFGVPWGVTL